MTLEISEKARNKKEIKEVQAAVQSWRGLYTGTVLLPGRNVTSPLPI